MDYMDPNVSCPQKAVEINHSFNLVHQIPKLKCLSPRLAVVFMQSVEARCKVENEDVVGATPTGIEVVGGYTGFTSSVCQSVHPSVCRRHGLRSISQICCGISISNFIHMLIVAYWFSVMSLPKWPPGGHLGFFGFRTLPLIWLWISTPKFSSTIFVHMGRSLLIYIGGHIGFFAFWTQLGFWCLVWIFSFKFMCMLFVAMDRSLLIISYVTFKIAIWQPYWIFWFLDSKFSLSSKLQWHITGICV